MNQPLNRTLLLAVSALMTSAPALAQTPPSDAGQTLQQLQAPALPAPVRPVSPLELPPERAAEPAGADTGPRFLVKRFKVVGSTVFPAEALESLMVTLTGEPHNLAELNEAARLITRFYRQKGYPVARAYLPAQTVTDGEVTINVLEGRLGGIVVNNASSVSDGKLRDVAAAYIKPGQLLRAPALNQALLLLNDLPGVGRVQGALRSGDEVGTSNLVLTVPAGPRYAGALTLDNHGSRYTGQNRLTGQLAMNNPLGIGDRLDARLAVSDADLAYGRLAWDLPVGNGGLRLGPSLSYSRYVLGDAFASLDVHGTAQTFGLQLSYPFRLALQTHIFAGLTLEQRKLNDVIGSEQSETDKTLSSATLNLSGDHAGNGRSTAWRVDLTTGQLGIDTPRALSIDQGSAQTDGSYTKLTMGVNHLRALTPKASLYLVASGQWASKNLDTSEKFALGGASAVRAYPSGEGLGDQGWLATLEWRYLLMPSVQAIAFYDIGGIDINQDPYTTADNSRQLSGPGVGLSAMPVSRLTLRATAAWRDAEHPLSDDDQRPRVWAQASYQF